MFKNYFKTTLRNFSRNKAFSIINVLGLTVGITACLVIYLFVTHEMSYDSFHPDKKSIYRLVSDIQLTSGEKFSMTIIPRPDLMSEAIRKELTGIETETVLYYYYAKTTIPDGSRDPKRFDPPTYRGEAPDKISITEPQYFQLFQYRWLAGNRSTALNQPFKVVLSKNKAHTYFGSIPVSQMIGREVIYNDSLHVTVSGIVEDWNKNTNLNFSDFISASIADHSFLATDNAWKDESQLYVKLSKGTGPARIENRIVPLIKAHLQGSNGEKIGIRLEPLTDIHFHAGYARDPSASRKASLPTLYGLMAIAAFILVIAAINFINLSTAQSLRRSKEIGIRKVLGSSRAGLVVHFLSETFLLTGIASFVSFLAAGPLLKMWGDFIPKGAAFGLTDATTWLFLLLTVVLTSLLAGLYPAKVLSSYNPAHSLKGQPGQSSNQKDRLRKGLIVFQFTISLIFIIASIIVGSQIRFVLNKDLGFAKDAIINIGTDDHYPVAKRKLLAEKVGGIPGVDQTCFSWETPAVNYLRGGNLKRKDNGTEIFSEQRNGDADYIPLYGLKVIAGRNFTNPVNDTLEETIINEMGARQLGFARPQDAIGRLVETEFTGTKPLHIVGVVANFNARSLHEPINPVFIVASAYSSQMSVKLSSTGKQGGNFKTTIAAIEKLWSQIYPGQPFNYNFFDETVARFYEKERQMEQIMNTAMAIAIFISCMGLFGLISFSAEQRTREIGIRKVLGASVTGVVLLLSKDLLKLVLLAVLVASPIAWYFMHRWLQDFAYRISISWWVFVLAGLSALLIALFTVSYQAIKAAMANPVKSLRSQ